MKRAMLFSCEVLVSLILATGLASAQDAAKSADSGLCMQTFKIRRAAGR